MSALNPNDYVYLWHPTQQILDKNGKPLIGGYVMVNVAGTTGMQAQTYLDWNGTENAEKIMLDSLGRATCIVSDSMRYDMYVYNKFNALEYSALNICGISGDGAGNLHFTSSDGSIIITRNQNNVDLVVHSDERSWGKAIGEGQNVDGSIDFTEQRYGNIAVDSGALILEAGKLYHVTIEMKIDNATIGTDYVDCNILDIRAQRHYFTLDESRTSQFVELSWDMQSIGTYAKFIATIPERFTISEASIYIHAVNSLTVSGSGGGGETYTAGDGINISPENVISADYTKVQEKLVAGENITIDPLTNTISASGGSFSQEQANWTETDTSDPSYIQNKPDLDQYAKTADLAPVALSNDYTDLNNRPSIPVVNDGTLTIQKNGSTIDTFSANSSANKTVNVTVPTKTSDITNDSGFITANDIPAQVNADWNASSGVAEILNKPTIPVVGTITL